MCEANPLERQRESRKTAQSIRIDGAAKQHFSKKDTSQPAPTFSIKLEVFVVLGCVRTAHCKLTTAHINELCAGNIFATATIAPCRLLDRLYSRVATKLKHQVSNGHFTNATTQTIKHKMVLVY